MKNSVSNIYNLNSSKNNLYDLFELCFGNSNPVLEKLGKFLEQKFIRDRWSSKSPCDLEIARMIISNSQNHELLETNDIG